MEIYHMGLELNQEYTELLKKSFSKGYYLGQQDAKEGIHINIAEMLDNFLLEIHSEFPLKVPEKT
jgi:elongation factor P--beta-lysine ligase